MHSPMLAPQWTASFSSSTWLLQGREDAVAHARGARQCGGRHQHGKFIAAQTGHGVRVADGLLDALADGGQHLVPGGVAEGVVDALEGVKVQQEDGGRQAAPLSLRQCLVEGADKGRAVREARQGVRQRHLLHFQMGFVEQPGAQFHPLFKLLVHDLQILGEEVGAHDDGIQFIPGGGYFDSGVELACGKADDSVQQLAQARIAVSEHRRVPSTN